MRFKKVLVRHSGIKRLLTFINIGLIATSGVMLPRIIDGFEKSESAGWEEVNFSLTTMIAAVCGFLLLEEVACWIMYIRTCLLHRPSRNRAVCFRAVDTYERLSDYAGEELFNKEWNQHIFVIPETTGLRICTGDIKDIKVDLAVPYEQVVDIEFSRDIKIPALSFSCGFILKLSDGLEIPFALVRRGTYLNMQMPRAKAYALFEQLRDEIMVRKAESAAAS